MEGKRLEFFAINERLPSGEIEIPYLFMGVPEEADQFTDHLRRQCRDSGGRSTFWWSQPPMMSLLQPTDADCGDCG